MKHFNATDQGIKLAMTHRGITHCKDYTHEKSGIEGAEGVWKAHPVPDEPVPTPDFTVRRRSLTRIIVVQRRKPPESCASLFQAGLKAPLSFAPHLCWRLLLHVL